MKKVLIPTILFIIILTILASANTWVIEGDKVIFENQYGKIVVWPHTGQNIVTQTQYSNITSYFEQPINLDFAFRISSNKADMIGNKKIYIWKNTSHEVPTYENQTFYLDCNYPDSSYNYTLDPKYAWCWNDTVAGNQTLVWGHWFDGGNINNKTIWWDEPVQTGTHEEYWFDWKDITNKFEYKEYQGNDYYIIKNITFQPNETKYAKWHYDIPVNTNGKWEVFVKRSQDTLQEALSSGKYVHLDPWWNSSWEYKRLLNITNQNSTEILREGYTVQFGLNTTNQTAFHEANGIDMRVVYNDSTELDRWIENFNTTNTTILFKLQANISGDSFDDTLYYLYYSNDSTINNPGEDWEDIWLNCSDNFNDNVADSWTNITGVWVAQNGLLNLTSANPVSDWENRVVCEGVNESNVVIESIVRRNTDQYMGTPLCWRGIDVNDTLNSGEFWTFSLSTSGTVGKSLGKTYYGLWEWSQTDQNYTINTSHNYTLKVVSYFDNHTYYINGTMENSYENNSIDRSGYVLLRSSNVNDWYDNYTVRLYMEPEPLIIVGGEEELYNTPPSTPQLNMPLNETGSDTTPEFNWTNSVDADNDTITYVIEIDNNTDFSSPEYLNSSVPEDPDGVTGIVPTNLTMDNTYYWHVKATTNTSYNNESNWSGTWVFQYANWTITFNLTDSYTGVQIDTQGPASFDITCNNSWNVTNVENPYTATDIFAPGVWSCDFSDLDPLLYYDKSSFIFNADSDKTVNVPMSEEGVLTGEEHVWLEAIYNCLYNGNCTTYNLLTEINQTTSKIWSQFKRTDQSIVTNETIISSVVNATSNLTIDYTVNVPTKEGYGIVEGIQGYDDFLPIRLSYWFLSENNLTCYNQANQNNSAESPYCNPLVAQTVGQINTTINLTVDLRPELPPGNYTIVRSIEIDPDNIWIDYGQEIIGRVEVLESGEATVSLKGIVPPINPTGLIIGDILTATNISLIVSMMTLGLVGYLIIRRKHSF